MIRGRNMEFRFYFYEAMKKIEITVVGSQFCWWSGVFMNDVSTQYYVMRGAGKRIGKHCRVGTSEVLPTTIHHGL